MLILPTNTVTSTQASKYVGQGLIGAQVLSYNTSSTLDGAEPYLSKQAGVEGRGKFHKRCQVNLMRVPKLHPMLYPPGTRGNSHVVSYVETGSGPDPSQLLWTSCSVLQAC